MFCAHVCVCVSVFCAHVCVFVCAWLSLPHLSPISLPLSHTHTPLFDADAACACGRGSDEWQSLRYDLRQKNMGITLLPNGVVRKHLEQEGLVCVLNSVFVLGGGGS